MLQNGRSNWGNAQNQDLINLHQLVTTCTNLHQLVPTCTNLETRLRDLQYVVYRVLTLERDEEKTKDLRRVVNEEIRAACWLLFLYASLENEIALH